MWAFIVSAFKWVFGLLWSILSWVYSVFLWCVAGIVLLALLLSLWLWWAERQDEKELEGKTLPPPEDDGFERGVGAGYFLDLWKRR